MNLSLAQPSAWTWWQIRRALGGTVDVPIIPTEQGSHRYATPTTARTPASFLRALAPYFRLALARSDYVALRRAVWRPYPVGTLRRRNYNNWGHWRRLPTGERITPQRWRQLSFSVVMSHATRWMTPNEREAVAAAYFGIPSPRLLRFMDAPMLQPIPVIRLRTQGFGRPSPRISVSHLTPLGGVLIHFAWDYLSSFDRVRVATSFAAVGAYAQYRFQAQTAPISELAQQRPPLAEKPAISDRRTRLATYLFLRFDLQYPDVIRFLGHEYTPAWERLHAVWRIIDEHRRRSGDGPIVPDGPRPDFRRVLRIQTEGSPLEGHFQCSVEALHLRNLYDNHQSLTAVADDYFAKLQKEEDRSYHILFPRFLWQFFPGLHLAFINWVPPRPHKPNDEGRLTVDPTTVLSPRRTQSLMSASAGHGPILNSADFLADESPTTETAPLDDGAANASIPRPGMPGGYDQNPPIYYSTAFTRMLELIWNLRIRHPHSDIRAAADDISAAFRWLLYHPDLASVFATVFRRWLILPTSLIFGAANSPSFYMLLGELRAWLSSVGAFGPNSSSLMQCVEIPPTPLDVHLTQAQPDRRQNGSLLDYTPRQLIHAAYVDDQGTAQTIDHVWEALNNSVLAAYVVFSFPDEDRRPPCINPRKWSVTLAAILLFLGFEIDTRALTVSWPREKRESLRTLLRTTFLRPRPYASCPIRVTPQEAARVLGTVRNGALVAPLGNLLSLNLQLAVNRAMTMQLSSGRRDTLGRDFWQRTRFRVPNTVIDDLRMLDASFDHDDVWTRSIGLLIPREPCAEPTGDAAPSGMGGYCTWDGYMWRLSAADLRAYGIQVPTPAELARQRQASVDYDEKVHINILEFVVIIINMLFSLSFQKRHSERDEFVYNPKTDNTSALSWIRYSGKHVNPVVSNLARLLTKLAILHPQTLIMGVHIPGKLNGPADALSRPSDFPTWASAIEQHSETLGGLQAYQVPPVWLSTIAMLLSSKRTVALSDEKMTELLTQEPRILAPGWRTSASFVSSAVRP